LEGSAPYQVAVIQEPPATSEDKNGYYIKGSCLNDSPLLDPELQYKENLNLSLKKVFTITLIRLKRLMSQFQFYRCLSQVLTEETGTPFSKKPDMWYETIKEVWKNYETHLKATITINRKAKESLENLQGIINLDNFQIPPAVAEQFRKDLTSENARLWANRCMKLYYDYELTCVDVAGEEETKARHEA
jgi:hypothetical protein